MVLPPSTSVEPLWCQSLIAKYKAGWTCCLTCLASVCLRKTSVVEEIINDADVCCVKKVFFIQINALKMYRLNLFSKQWLCVCIVTLMPKYRNWIETLALSFPGAGLGDSPTHVLDARGAIRVDMLTCHSGRDMNTWSSLHPRVHWFRCWIRNLNLCVIGALLILLVRIKLVRLKMFFFFYLIK